MREKASQTLREAGAAVRMALVKALKDKPGAEKQRRLEELLNARASGAPSPEMMRPVRAMEILERLDTAEARQLLESLAKGNPSARQTVEAAAVLRRHFPK